MPIIKDIPNLSGAIGALHAVVTISFTKGDGGAVTSQVTIGSWPTILRFLDGEPAMSRIAINMPVTPSATMFADVEAELIASDPVYAGGTYSASVPATTLDQIKAEAIVAFTAERNEIEFTGGFTAVGAYAFKSDLHSQSKLAAHANRARKAIADADTGWSVVMDLYDGTTLEMDAADVLDAASALSDKIAELDEDLRTVIAAINAATTEEEVTAVGWPP